MDVQKRNLVGLQISHEMIALAAPLNRQVNLAKVLDIAQSTLNQYISGKRIPDAAGLRKLCTLWPNPAGGQRILLAHLKDQIAASGIDQNCVTVTSTVITDPNPELSADLALLKQEATAVPAVAAVVHAQAELIRQAYMLNEMPVASAAESRATYSTKPRARPNPEAPPAIPTAAAHGHARATGAAGRKSAQ